MQVFVAALLAVLVAAADFTGPSYVPLTLAYATMGLLSFGLYGVDKRLAGTQRRRISERSLCALDLCFGIIGGLIGQVVFRHKVRKHAYLAKTLLITIAHCVGLSALIFAILST